MDEHLRNNQRSNLSALLVTGVWVESLYLITQVAKEQPSDRLRETIGEQKRILNNLLPIMKLFKNSDKNFEELVQYLEELKEVFDVVKITDHVDENPEVREDGVIVQNEYSVVELSKEELQEIITTTEKIRNKIVK
jgi:F0F1-type ATP synthase delta subunit